MHFQLKLVFSVRLQNVFQAETNGCKQRGGEDLQEEKKKKKKSTFVALLRILKNKNKNYCLTSIFALLCFSVSDLIYHLLSLCSFLPLQ